MVSQQPPLQWSVSDLLRRAWPPPSTPEPPPGLLRDGVFLAALILLSSITYLTGLGLYSDDWALLADLHATDDRSILALYRALLPSGINTRPVQGLYLAVLYRLFGLDPLGYHVVNITVLIVTVVLFHLVLRRLHLPRSFAVAVPLVFGLLPHYSTDRFWIAAFQANLAGGLYLLSLYSDLRFVERPHGLRWSWKILGTFALLASVLAYEITAPLFLLSPLVLWYAARIPQPVPRPGGPRNIVVLSAVNLLALALAVAYKSTTTERTALLGGLVWRITRTAREATVVSFGSYGLGLPGKVVGVMRDYFDPLILLVSIVVAVGVWIYFSPAVLRHPRPFLPRRSWAVLLLPGLVLFGAGHGISLMTFEIGFHTTGINNRTAAAAALGVGWTFVAAVGWASAWLPTEQLRWASFRLLVASLAGSGCLLVNTIGGFWTEAAHQQEEIIDTLKGRIPAPPPGTTLLLNGVCPYLGPSIVFETNWDVSGMLRLVYGDQSLSGDVVKPNTGVTPEGIRTLLYDDVINVYPYGEGLLVFDLSSSEVHAMPTLGDAQRYFHDLEARTAHLCPPGEEGYGVRIF